MILSFPRLKRSSITHPYQSRLVITETFCKTFYQLQGVYIYPKETRALKTARAPEVVVPVPEYERGDLP